MKPEDIKSADVTALLEEYVEAVVRQREATGWRKANVQADILAAITAEIRARGADAEGAFLRLLSHSSPSVRFGVAGAALDFAPEQAEAVMLELARLENSVGFDARMTLFAVRGIDIPSPKTVNVSAAQIMPQPAVALNGHRDDISPIHEDPGLGLLAFPDGAGITKESLAGVIHSSSLTRIADELCALLADSVRLMARPLENDDVPVGQSKIGGAPDLPREIAWPRRDGEPMSFIAQIALSEATRFDAATILPPSGMLYFFYDAMDEPWGFDPRDRGSCRVIHFSGESSSLVRTSFPDDLSTYGRFVPCHVEFTEEVTIPDLFSLHIEGLDLDAHERNLYGELHEILSEARSGDGTGVHRLLGHPDQIQKDMQRECQLVSHGIYLGGTDGYNDPRIPELMKGAKDWTLLLQIEGYEVENRPAVYSDMMWGDAGRIYFWIPRGSLEARSFEDAWLILQCG